MGKLRIFELRYADNERDWISANTVIEAIQFNCEINGDGIFDLDSEDDIIELPEEKWDEMNVLNTEYDETDPDDWEKMTFRQWMTEHNEVGLIASTLQ